MQHDRFAFHLLLHSADLVEERLRHRLAPLGVRPRQARVLEALDRMGAVSQTDLAREFGVTAASMSTMTARLIASGFVLREPDPAELRSNVLRLSETGHALLDDIRAAWADIDRAIIEALGPEEARTLAALARELRDALGGRAPGTPPQREPD